MEAKAEELVLRYRREADTIAWLFPGFWSKLVAILPGLGTQTRAKPEGKATEGELTATPPDLETQTFPQPEEELPMAHEEVARAFPAATASPKTKKKMRDNEDVRPTSGRARYD